MPLKIGLGLYRHMLTADNLKFAKQCGCTHIVAHLVDYLKGGQLHGTDKYTSWGIVQNQQFLWTVQQLQDLKRFVNSEGLELEAIENFDPSHWYDVLLDGPGKKQQLENLKTMVRRVGEVGIPIIGYNFSLAGVWGHVVGPWARGGAESVAFLGAQGPEETPIPHGQVWNMVYDQEAARGFVGQIDSDELWQRLAVFLRELVPVAEEAGVRLAAHPDDPPMPTLRGTPRLVYQPQMYQRLLDMTPSKSNALEFCVGSIQEMTDGDVYDATEDYAKQGAIAYIHLRNVRGKVPSYQEVFIDEGEIDISRILHILHDAEWDGVLIPDHTPSVTCGAPWHAGMAYALGYMHATIASLKN